MSSTKVLPSVLLLATPHLSEMRGREAEAEEVVNRLSRFNPDMVAVEVRPKEENGVQERYERFLAGAEPLGDSEIDQIAFRVAQHCGVPAIRFGTSSSSLTPPSIKSSIIAPMCGWRR